MARTTHVKKAQQRYVTVPVIDPATGVQKITPVMVTRQVRQDDGTIVTVSRQKVTRHGKPVTMKVTEADKNQPKPNRTCEKCATEIQVGQPYKHVTPKSGPYGGRKRVRCAACPGWQQWDLSNSLSARLALIAHDASLAAEDATDADSASSVFTDAAESIREIAEEKLESAENIREGFGHDTSSSEELDSVAEELDSWADEVENADLPDFPEPEEEDCDNCGGSGLAEPDNCGTCEGLGEDADGVVCEDCFGGGEAEAETCEECVGGGKHVPDEPSEYQMDEWREELTAALDIIDNSPV